MIGVLATSLIVNGIVIAHAILNPPLFLTSLLAVAK